MKEIKINNKTYPVVISKKKIKHLYLRIGKDGSLHISVPRSITSTQLLRFIEKNQDWIEKNIQKLEKKQQVEELNDEVILLGKSYPIKRVYKEKGKSIAYVDHDVFIFELNRHKDNSLEKIFDSFAKETLSKLVSERRQPLDKMYAPNKDVRFVYRKMSSRWGVCHIDKNYITMNTRLIHYPIEAFEYVLLHEYVHFKIPNHSKSFYLEIQRVMKDYKERKALLK